MSETTGTATAVDNPDVQKFGTAAPSNGATQSNIDPMDKFGRTESERTITLEVDDAERVGNEVEVGKHQTYDDALHYIIERGCAEIKRQRDTAVKQKVQRDDAKFTEALRTACANNPGVMNDPVQLANLIKALGFKPKN